MRPKLSIRTIVVLFVLLSAFFSVELATDYLWTGTGERDLSDSVEWSRTHVSNLARSLNVLCQLVVIATALAIPLTSTIYTPRLIDVFLRDRVNQFMLGYYFLGMANGMFVSYWMRDAFIPSLAIRVLEVQFTLGVAMLVPYYYYMFRTLEPSSITAVLAERAEQSLDELARAASPTNESRDQLRERLHHMGNIVLRSIERADRDLSLEAVASIRRVMRRYAMVKAQLPASWFLPDRRHFPAFSEAAFDLLSKDGTWVEHTAIHQLEQAYVASLGKLSDIVGGIAHAVQEIGGEANRADDERVLQLTIRYMNTFTRHAIESRHLGSIYDTLEHYGRLARDLLGPRPELAAQIARHFAYYAGLARATNVRFVAGLVGHDLSRVAEAAYAMRAGCREEILETFLGIPAGAGEHPSPRLAKARVFLAAFFQEKGMEFERDRVLLALSGIDSPMADRIARDFAETEQARFWEVNNRQVNLDYVPPARLPHVQAVLDRLQGPS